MVSKVFSPSSIIRALSRSRGWILSMALTYALSVSAGIWMAHTGNHLALSQRDRMVANARTKSPVTKAYREGHRFTAAMLDFGGNLVAGMGQTAGGLGVVLPYITAVHRGWVGGIVSVDREHKSRLTEPRKAAYYFITLILQLIPYSLAGGVGMALGMSYYRPRAPYLGAKWHGLSREALLDVCRVYVLIIPLFFIASLWEFLSRWN